MTYANKSGLIIVTIVYGLGAIGLSLKAPEYIQRIMAAPSSMEVQ